MPLPTVQLVSREVYMPTGMVTADSLPDELQLHPTGFLGSTDGELLYGFRRTHREVSIGDDATVTLNGQLKGDGRLPRINATEGHGVYVSNTPRLTLPGITGDTLTVVEFPTEGIFDVYKGAPTTAAHVTAAALHRLRAVLPGVLNPGTRAWDALYGPKEATSAVVFAPMLAARFCLGVSTALGRDIEFPPIPSRWALLRDTSKARVVGVGQYSRAERESR